MKQAQQYVYGVEYGDTRQLLTTLQTFFTGGPNSHFAETAGHLLIITNKISTARHAAALFIHIQRSRATYPAQVHAEWRPLRR